MAGVCEVLDRGDAGRPYALALATQAAKVANIELTPSARLMREMATSVNTAAAGGNASLMTLAEG